MGCRSRARTSTRTSARSLTTCPSRVTEVHAHFIGEKNRPTKGTLVVKPHRGDVLAAGSIGKYPEKTHPAYGVPDNMWSPKFADGPTGYLVETGSFFPVLSAASTLQHGPELHRIMSDYYPFGTISYAHHTTGFDDAEKYGTVKLDDHGDPQLDYVIPQANITPMRESLERPAQREQFFLALLVTEVRLLTLFSGAPPGAFSHLSLADRQKVLESLRASRKQQSRNIYAAFVNVSASTFYASDLTWPGLSYPGVSVDHPEILNPPPTDVPWRPDDHRPVEP